MLTKASIRFVRVLPNALKAEKKTDYPSALVGFQRSNFALVANAATYDLVDLENNQKIPLFEISSGGLDNEDFEEDDEVPPIETKTPGQDESIKTNEELEQQTDKQSTEATEAEEESSVDKEPTSPKDEQESDETASTEETPKDTPAPKTEDEDTKPVDLPKPTIEHPTPVAKKQHTKPPRKLKPMICAVSSDEFLLTSGTTINEPAMGLVVNTDGDISRGTIAWPKYPSSVAVDYPYVASAIDNQIYFYSLHDQDLVQTIEYKSRPQVFTVTSPISQAYLPLSEKIRLVPLNISTSPTEEPKPTEDQSKRIEKEKAHAESLSVISSSLFVYSKEAGVQCLLSSPRIFHLEKLVEQSRLDEVKEEMSTIEINTERAFVEIEYLGLLVGVGYLMHGDFDTATSAWLEGTLDPRIVIYIFNKESVNGDLWTFNGLIPFLKTTIEKLEGLRVTAAATPAEESAPTPAPATNTPKRSKKSKKGAKNNRAETKAAAAASKPTPGPSTVSIDEAKKKLTESRQYYAYFLGEWLKRRELESIVDKTAVFYSLELAYLRLSLEDKAAATAARDQEALSQSKTKLYTFLRREVVESVEDTLKILGKNDMYYGQFLLYEKYEREAEFCELWKRALSDGTISEVDPDFLSNKTEEAFASYLQHTCEDHDLVWNHGMWLVERNVKIGLPIFTHRSPDSQVQFQDDDVLAALKKLKNPHAWRSFLKILVYERHDLSRQGDLIEISAEDLVERIKLSATMRDIVAESYVEYKNLALPKRGYLDFMHSKMSRSAGGSEEAEITKMRLDLVRLLLGEGQYDIDVIRDKLEQCGYEELLVVELCVIYSKLGMHERCIRILAHSLLDFDQSVDYCRNGRLVVKTLKVGGVKSLVSKDTKSSGKTARKDQQEHPSQEADDATQRRLFTILFDEFLSISFESTRSLYLRMLLERYGDKLDTFTVLRKTPSEWPLERISGYLYSVLRQVMADKNESMVTKALARAQNTYIAGFHRQMQRAADKAQEEQEDEED